MSDECPLPLGVRFAYMQDVRPGSNLGRAALLALLALGPVINPTELQSQTGGTYSETVTFRLRQSDSTYNGSLNELMLLLDREGGRNPLWSGRLMTNVGGDNWEVTLTLDEGDYI